ncbi:AraC family transcriptional regulator [Leisingera sp. SS27]|uniref:AraC family transcriptional regulator n=1 Tax=Leisingera sp. SS27 TaxID=2979462 RepID=UPI00232CF88F|nr:AraC family transcriptional regulator [Leisingera sp. SS27]MDC0659365.1 AraC family transcriptional regulator [Leisingera sp. SS27]
MPDIARDLGQSVVWCDKVETGIQPKRGKRGMASRTHQTLSDLGADGTNSLVIPQGLHDFADAQVVMEHGQQAIFHKRILSSAFGVEFYNSCPCLGYIIKGEEVFITPTGEEITVGAGEMVLLPRDVFMVTNFSGSDGPLEALLFFFDDTVIREFERQSPGHSAHPTSRIGAYKIDHHNSLNGFMSSMIDIYKTIDGTRELLHTKLMELLFLIAAEDESMRLRSFLHENCSDSGKRNIRHLMREHCTHNLSVHDYAHLSGRSVSAFNREFKRQFGVAPSKWLIEQRLTRARDAVLSTDASITEIGFEIGYESTSHFIAQFKSMFGTTPKQLRLEQL